MLLTRPPLSSRRKTVRLACVKHAASVCPEPGSNSPNKAETITDLNQAHSDVLPSSCGLKELTVFTFYFLHSSVVKVLLRFPVFTGAKISISNAGGNVKEIYH